MPEVKIHLELILPAERLSVNALIALFQQLLRQLVPQLVAAWLEAWQELELTRWLGTRWNPAQQGPTPWACPTCQSRQRFGWRGCRSRVLRKTSLGRLPFELRQVTCHSCGQVFAPLAELLELKPYQVSTTEFRARAVESVCQVSYQRAATMVSHAPLVAAVSAMAIHAWVQQQGAQVVFEAEPADARPLILDGTKVKAGPHPRGVPLNLGMTLLKRTTAGGRPQLLKRVVALGVDTPWATTLQPLAKVQPERITFDGDPDLAQVIEALWPETPLQRCLWHLPHQLYRALWEDRVLKVDSQPIQDRLTELLYHSPTVEQARAAYQALYDELCLEGLAHAACYLRDAQPHVFTFREHPEGIFIGRSWTTGGQALLGTSPLEREMREIDRRTDNGSRWSVPGVRHLVGLDLVRRYDVSQWQRLWQLPDTLQLPGSVMILKVQAETLGPALNVKTT